MKNNAVIRAVGIEPTNHCNLKCKVCWSQNPKLHPPRPRGYMTWQLFTKTIDELAEYRQASGEHMKVCMNYGGESMLHPKYCDMIRYAASKNCFELRAITNATLLTKEIIHTLIDCNVHVTVSIHNSPETVKAYQKVLRLVAHRGHSQPIDGSIVYDEFEHNEVMQRMRWWSQILDEVRVYALQGEDLKFVNFEKPNHDPCVQPSYYMGILWNGDTYPCCHLLSTEFKGMGNVAESSIEEVWNGERYTQLRRHQLEDAPCRECEFW